MTTESECIAALREAAERLGESPTKNQYEELGLTPASATIQRVMGGWNAAKEAAGLETHPSTGTRTEPKPDDVDLPTETTWADLSVDQRWHYRNPERNAQRTLERRQRLRTWVDDLKRERGCNRCDVADPTVLDFHHLDPEDKTMDVGTMVTYGYGTEALREEITQCEVLCANCHRLIHDRQDPERSGVREWLRERKRASDGCSSCDVEHPACLVYHHVDGEKVATIASLASDGRPREAIREEMAKCEVLCANCHRRQHRESHDPDAASSEHS